MIFIYLHKTKLFRSLITLFLVTAFLFPAINAELLAESRNEWQQPEKVMKVLGIRKGMVIGEPGAGRGYWTYRLAKRVGKSGKIYANDIKESLLIDMEKYCDKHNIKNIITVLGEVDNPLFPKNKMDMVIMTYVLHDMTQPVDFLINLKPSMKPGALLILIEREPEKTDSPYEKSHFMRRSELLETVKEAGYKLYREENFLKYDNIYFFRPIR